MSEPPTDEDWARLRGEAGGHTELQGLVRKMETLVEDGRHKRWIQDRQKRIDILVIEFQGERLQGIKGQGKARLQAD